MNQYWLLSRWYLLSCGAVPVVLGTLMAIAGWMWRESAAAFLENLQQTDGVVVKVRPEGGLVDVEYQDRAGVVYRKELQVDSRTERQLRAVEKVTLVYDTRTPDDAAIGTVVSAHHQTLYAAALAGLGLLLIGTGAFLAGRRISNLYRKLALFRTGHMVLTEVRDVATSPDEAMGRFTYAFRGPNGRWFEGSSPEIPVALLAEWPVGRKVIAVYDPLEPKRTEADIFGVIDAARRAQIQPA
jgi:hypothetical protein